MAEIDAGSKKEAPGADDLAGWQQRALDRSLIEAKRRALNKSNGFVQAAMRLLNETGSLDFTVQDVVDRSGLSLRSFYQTFGSKDDLTLAVFEECVASAAAWLREVMAQYDDPIDEVRAVLTNVWTGKLSPEVTLAVTLFALKLSATRPAELARALEPQVAVLLEAVERGMASGQIRTDIDSRPLAELLLHTANAAVQTTILHTGSESADVFWAFCLSGIRAEGAASPSSRSKTTKRR
jgi:AcrR family transcriptional regulator